MTNYSLTNRGVVLFFYFLIVLLGMQSVIKIPKQESPDFPSWNAVIVTNFPGASPLKMEELITEKIEEKMKEVGELKEINSTSIVGVSYVFLVVKESIEDVKPVWDKVREKLGDLQGQLPNGASNPWLNNDFGKSKSIVIAVTGDGFSNHELVETAKDLKKELGRLQYVSRVDIEGELAERIYLESSNVKLAELGMGVQQIANILEEQNVLSPGGNIKVGPQTIRIQPTGEFESVEEIRKTVIAIPGSNNLFFLEDLFSIKREYIDPPTYQIRYMGKDAIMVVVEMQDGGQILELGKNVKQLLEEQLQQTYLGINFDILNYQPFWVARKINDFVNNLWQAVAVVAVVMILLLGWREGIIISMLIPFTFLITLNVMVFVGIPLHQISIAALIIALGMLVDNGIVMTESISNYAKSGLTIRQAAVKASKELTIPLLTATATTIAAFLPVALAKSAVGIFCRSITFVVGIVLLSSFFVAMTLIPVLCAYLLKSKKKKESQSSRIVSFYPKLMRWCLQYRYLTLLGVVLVFMAGMQLSGHIRNVFFPPSDRFQFIIDFYLPEGTDYRETRQQVLQVEADLLEKYADQISNMALYIGKGGPRFHMSASGEQQTSNYAQFVINNHTIEETEQMMAELGSYFKQHYPSAGAIVKSLDSGPPVGAPIQLKVYGKDLPKLYAYTQQVQELLETEAGVRDIRDDWGALVPKLSIDINQDQARRIGVSTQSIAQVLAGSFVGGTLTEFREGDKSIPIIIRSPEEERTSLQYLQNLNVPTSQGTSVPLLQVANIQLKWEAGKIRHLNRRRTITIQAYLSSDRSAIEILNAVEAKAAAMKFDPGYGVIFSGEAEKSQEANQSIMDQLPIALALLVMILVMQFGNVRKMIIILVTIPLSFLGIILGLFLVDYPFGFLAFLGVISLAGIVVNNAILLLEQIDVDLKAGKPPIEAIISAGQRRAFPILLTTITTVSGLFPLAISGEFWGPMAVTIMGGLIISTLLTLVVIPLIYSIFFRVATHKGA